LKKIKNPHSRAIITRRKWEFDKIEQN